MESIQNKFSGVRYANLPPMRTAAFCAVGKEPEDAAMAPVMKWIKDNNLHGTARFYLFNTEPYQEQTTDGTYGMGCCATIPEGVEIPEPLHEMRLPGGTYAVISDYEGDPSFGWRKMFELVGDKEWEWEWEQTRIGHPLPGLEEHIERPNGYFPIPVMLPVKKKE